MKKDLILILNCLVLILASCEKPSEPGKSDGNSEQEKITAGHNARNSLDYLGTYKGVLPCADCEGIETTIVLNKDETYVKTTKYLGKGENAFKELGDFTWMEDGNTMSLEGVDSEPVLYKVEEGKLIMLNLDGEKITGDLYQFYELTKQ